MKWPWSKQDAAVVVDGRKITLKNGETMHVSRTRGVAVERTRQRFAPITGDTMDLKRRRSSTFWPQYVGKAWDDNIENMIEKIKKDQREKMSNEKKKMSRGEARKAAFEKMSSIRDICTVSHLPELKKYVVSPAGEFLSEFCYDNEPEPDPIKEGVLCVGEYSDGGISTGRSLGVFDFKGLDTFCNNTKAAGRGSLGFNLKNARPVTLADLIEWGHEVDTFNTCDSMCQTCLHVNVKATSEPCKSCETTMGTNYEKGGIDGH